MLEVKNLNIEYLKGDLKFQAVKDVSFKIDNNQSMGLIGESGSGKTSVAMGILNLIDKKNVDLSGEILYNGENILTMSNNEFNKFRWCDISVVFQKSMNAFSPVHKISELCIDICKQHKDRIVIEDVEKNTTELFSLLNLSEDVYRKYPFELSGGMKQRVLIALSLLLKPKLVVWDEITSSIDTITKNIFLKELKGINELIKFAKLIITHDLTVAEELCDKLLVMYQGKIVEIGNTRDIISFPKHPYTNDLISSRAYNDNSESNVIEKVVSDSSLCGYLHKCKYSRGECWRTPPTLYSLNEDHQVLCNNQEG